jgi:hypothetical protein
LRAIRAVNTTVEVVQILVESFQKDTLRKGVQSSDCDVDEICVKLAELCQIGRIWVGCVAIECAIVAAWGNGMLRENKIDTPSDDVGGMNMLALKNPSGKRLSWKNLLATFMSSCPLESRPSMKKAMGKTDSAYAVKYRGEMKLNWGFVAMESWIL